MAARASSSACGSLASIVVGRLYPAAIQRFTVEPNQYAQEERYIGNNIAMTRLALRPRRLGGSLVPGRGRAHRRRPSRTRSTRSPTPGCGTTGRSATTLDQLQRVRRYYDFYDVDTDRYVIDGTQRQVMLSARELALDQNPGATGFVNQRIVYTHGIGVAMVPVNEVANEGQPRLFIRNLPPVSEPGAPGHHRAAHLLRRAAERLGHHRRAPDRVRLPDRRRATSGDGGDRDALDGHDRHQPRHDA